MNIVDAPPFAVIDALSAHIAVVDPDGTIVAVNRAWRAFAAANGSGLNVSEGANYFQVCDSAVGEDAAAAQAFAHGLRAILQGTDDKFLLEYPCHSPTEQRWFAGRITPLVYQEHIYAVVAHENITERKLAEVASTRLYEAEAHARRAAEETNRLRLRFLATVSHELRTPLTVIKGFASSLLALDLNWDSDSARQFVSYIDEAADELNDLIAHLLDFSRIREGTLRINRSLHSPYTLLDRLQKESHILAAQHQLMFELADDLPMLHIDLQRMFQVLGNLIDNAAKYSPPGTRITLSVKAVEEGVQFDVTDEGLGIAPEDRVVVFEAFRQLATTPNTVRKGVGLGLAICKDLVTAHNGQIWIQDKAPPGTTVSVILPAHDRVSVIEEDWSNGDHRRIL